MPKERMVCVEWEDAAYNSGYYDKKSPEDFIPVSTRTVGHLVKKTPKALLVSQDRFYKRDGKPEDDRHIGIIPKKMIKRLIYLEAVNNATKS